MIFVYQFRSLICQKFDSLNKFSQNLLDVIYIAHGENSF